MKNKLSRFAVPYEVWMAIFVVAPIVIIVVYAFSSADGGFSLENFVSMGEYTDVFLRSFKLALIATAVCLLIGYPVSYWMSREGKSFQRMAMVLIMLPMWMNFLLRTYSWMTILENNGLLNQLFQKIGLIALYNRVTGADVEFFQMINTQGAVVLGMVYNYLPFMILPIYSVIIKLDRSLIEAARDLGANSVMVFRKVILPLSLPGVLSGITMVFVPSVSTFAISRMLGGGTELLLGDLIERQFLGGAYNPQLGAAISLVMMVIVLVCMIVMNRFGEGEEQAMDIDATVKGATVASASISAYWLTTTTRTSSPRGTASSARRIMRTPPTFSSSLLRPKRRALPAAMTTQPIFLRKTDHAPLVSHSIPARAAQRQCFCAIRRLVLRKVLFKRREICYNKSDL